MKIRFINTNEVVDVDLSTCTTVRDILRTLSTTTGHEEDAIYMACQNTVVYEICRGKQLKADELLTTYQIVEESKIVAVYKKPPTSSANPATPVQKPQNSNLADPKPVTPVAPVAPVAPALPQTTSPSPKPAANEAPQSLMASALSSEDVTYTKQVLSSPSFHNLLVVCRHLPFHVTEVLLLLKQVDQRAYNTICKDKSILMNAIMSISETEVPRGTRPAPSGLSPVDEESIANLMSLGFSRQDCIAAYIACDKNVDAAANFLFSNS